MEFKVINFVGTTAAPETEDNAIQPTPTSTLLQGRVLDAAGNGLPGATILVQFGNSDALIVLGQTDSDGYYRGRLTIPPGTSVRIWPDLEGMNFYPQWSQFIQDDPQQDWEYNFGVPGSTPTSTSRK